MKNQIGFRADRTLGGKNGGVITYIKVTEAVDAEQLITKSNSYAEYQLIHMIKRNIVIINVYRPPDCPTEKFSSPFYIIIIKKGRQCMTEREWYTPYQSEDPSPTIPTYRQKDEKGKKIRRLQQGQSSLGQ